MTGAAGTKGNIHYLFLTHVRVEKWSLWRTSAALTPLKIEQEGGSRGGGTQVRGRTDFGRDLAETFRKQNTKAKCAEVFSRLL